MFILELCACNGACPVGQAEGRGLPQDTLTSGHYLYFITFDMSEIIVIIADGTCDTCMYTIWFSEGETEEGHWL